MQIFSQLIVLATSVLVLPLSHLAAAAESHFPVSILASQEVILASVRNTLSARDTTTKATLFAYRTLSTPQESWGFGFFEKETLYTPESISNRDFFVMAPPGSTKPIILTRFSEFLPLTEHNLFFIGQLYGSKVIRQIAEMQWHREDLQNNPELWYLEFIESIRAVLKLYETRDEGGLF
ncbi:MAG: hypothetical protein M1829_006062 [Trizodia sp. TS-e1964]|nr:MAG: hypothetical protein M1829_006062 [Trizodia sp. TS-e1964]